MLLSENHSADQSAFLDLCVSPSASILLFFLLFLLFSTHSNFYSNFFQNQIGRSYSCSQNCFRLHFSICHFSICAAQCKANDMGMQNAQQNALRPFFTSLEPQFVARLKSWPNVKAWRLCGWICHQTSSFAETGKRQNTIKAPDCFLTQFHLARGRVLQTFCLVGHRESCCYPFGIVKLIVCSAKCLTAVCSV